MSSLRFEVRVMDGPLKNSDGSAEWECGRSPQAVRVVCAVNGPIEVKLRDELPQDAAVELVYRRNVGLPMIREQLIQDRISTALLAVVRRDLMPRRLVQVVVQLLEAWEQPEGLALVAEISEAINCMSVALARSGVPLKGLLAARSYYIDANKSVWPSTVPPTADILSTHAVAFTYINGAVGDLVMVESSGSFSKGELLDMLKTAHTDCNAVAAEQAKIIKS